MSWVRSRLRFGARLALFALALQLVLSFGHVHLDDLVPPAASSIAAVPGAPDGQAPAGPAGHDPHGLGHDYCGVCALIQLAGTSIASVPPPLPLPGVFTELRHVAPVGVSFSASPRPLFQARAPPIA
jgi:hypothetical protein